MVWGPHHNHHMTATILGRLRDSSNADARLKEVLDTADGEGEDNKDVAVPPPPHAMQANIESLLDTLINQLTDKERAVPETDLSTLIGLSELKENEAHTLATSLHDLLERSHEASSGQDCVIRVMEVTESGAYLVMDELSTLGLPGGLTVEYFVASHDPELLKALSVR